MRNVVAFLALVNILLAVGAVTLLYLYLAKEKEFEIVFPRGKRIYDETRIILGFWQLAFFLCFLVVSDLGGIGYVSGFKIIDEEDKLIDDTRTKILAKAARIGGTAGGQEDIKDNLMNTGVESNAWAN